jgi:thymidylate synthase
MQNYKNLVKNVLLRGEPKIGRNGETLSLHGTQLKFNAEDIPLLNSRKIFYKGVIGEFAAFMNNAKTVQEFKDLGCNYWDSWEDINGELNLDYVNQLHKKVDGINSQLDIAKYELKTNPSSRRIMINLWRPENLETLSLPCCHFNYQFLVNNNRLDMIWTQRSADVMIGIPSDMILAYLWVQCLAKECNLEPGEVTMHFGDTHIYKGHIDNAYKYLEEVRPRLKPIAQLTEEFTTIESFTPDMLEVIQYDPHPALKFELKV